ncbi:MAG: murein L,D-transpeptidase catalytic domain family protein [Bacteroidales bacterium]|nr:murein L,D-transpeptidase catalytic domain family protein [Bacteroidales bacterium]
MRKKFFWILSIFALFALLLPGTLKSTGRKTVETGEAAVEDQFTEIYRKLAEPELDFIALKTALTGLESVLQKHEGLNPDIITIIDYSKPSTEKRLFIIDLSKEEVKYRTYVAHGRNTGLNYAESFSNKIHSYMSSLGFFITGNTYNGKHGYSLRLKGIEDGVNDNAWKRAIVMHPANYVSESYIEQYGRLGRSFGCPAIPVREHKYLIDLIKENTCLFAWYPDSVYQESSTYLN